MMLLVLLNKLEKNHTGEAQNHVAFHFLCGEKYLDCIMDRLISHVFFLNFDGLDPILYLQ